MEPAAVPDVSVTPPMPPPSDEVSPPSPPADPVVAEPPPPPPVEQTPAPTAVPPAKSRTTVALIASVVTVLIVGAGLAWLLWGKDDSQAIGMAGDTPTPVFVTDTPPSGDTPPSLTDKPVSTSTPMVLKVTATPTKTPKPTNTKIPKPTKTPRLPTTTPKPTRTPRPIPTPTATIDADPTVYDNFNNPAFDGSFNKHLWDFWSDPPNQISQQNGILVLSQEGKKEGTSLYARQQDFLTLADFTSNVPTFLEAKLMMDSEQHGAESSNVHLNIEAALPGDEFWSSECGISDGGWAYCFDNLWTEEGVWYDADGKEVGYGTWHTVRIVIDPVAMTFTYYIDGQMVGSHVPADAEALSLFSTP